MCEALPATDIQEIGRTTSIQLQNVHGGHGQTRAIDQTSDIPVELDEIETVLRRFHFGLVLLGAIPQLKDFRLAKFGIFIKA